ncbi:MAG TPA: hypothetical protein DD454_03575, partial [Candidatus Moranbacteria bacterium]|nr:hypothetical protein [Candidatus Moranbacteria bacterium]
VGSLEGTKARILAFLMVFRFFGGIFVFVFVLKNRFFIESFLFSLYESKKVLPWRRNTLDLPSYIHYSTLSTKKQV